MPPARAPRRCASRLKGGFVVKRIWLLVAAIAIFGSGCGGSSGSAASPTPVPPKEVISPTNASLEGIDCERERAYVPIQPSSGSEAEVAALDLSADPNTTDPRLKTIDLGAGFARGATIDGKQGLVLVVSESATSIGFLDVIDESDNSLVAGSPFSFPTGSVPDVSDGIVFDSQSDTALASMSTASAGCVGTSPNACTGMASFNLATNSFGSLIPYATSVNNFGFDAKAEIAIASSDPIEPLTYALNLAGNEACTLNDDSLESLNDGPEGAAVDADTGIWVVGQFSGVLTAVINLAGATFSGTPPNCTLNEFDSPPSNSIIFNTGAEDFLPGVTINPVTHQAFLSGLLDNTIALLNLPKHPVKYIDLSEISAVDASLPVEPDGVRFQASILPYADAIDTCHNRAYVVNQNKTFMAEIDLDKFKKNPDAINTALPAGNCAGTSTTLACDNQNGVRFFPLPTD